MNDVLLILCLLAIVLPCALYMRPTFDKIKNTIRSSLVLLATKGRNTLRMAHVRGGSVSHARAVSGVPVKVPDMLTMELEHYPVPVHGHAEHVAIVRELNACVLGERVRPELVVVPMVVQFQQLADRVAAAFAAFGLSVEQAASNLRRNLQTKG